MYEKKDSSKLKRSQMAQRTLHVVQANYFIG